MVFVYTEGKENVPVLLQVVLHIHFPVPLAGEGGVQVGKTALGLQVSQLSLIDVVVLAVAAAKEEVRRPQLDSCIQQNFLRTIKEVRKGHTVALMPERDAYLVGGAACPCA